MVTCATYCSDDDSEAAVRAGRRVRVPLDQQVASGLRRDEVMLPLLGKQIRDAAAHRRHHLKRQPESTINKDVVFRPLLETINKDVSSHHVWKVRLYKSEKHI